LVELEKKKKADAESKIQTLMEQLAALWFAPWSGNEMSLWSF
jgi:hypothetical protein